MKHLRKFNESLRDEIHSEVHPDWNDEPKTSKHTSQEHKHTITTYLDEIRDAINTIDDTSKVGIMALKDIEQQLSSIIHKHILD